MMFLKKKNFPQNELQVSLFFVIKNVPIISSMNGCTRKPTTCICENKDAGQLCSNCIADQCICFCYLDNTIPLFLKSDISSF